MKRLAAILLLCPALAGAYVISATLEYSVDDSVNFHLNGRPLLLKSEPHPFDYAVLSTSDGSLPLGWFNMNGENVLAAENLDMEGGVMLMSYRLSVQHSGGDAVVVWSEAENTRFLHLEPGQAAPPRWTLPDFDDKAWGPAVETRAEGEFVGRASLFDPAFDGLLGQKGRVPMLSHQFSAGSTGGQRNLFRSRFQFPNRMDRPQLLMNPPTARRGDKVALRVLPGRDTADLGDFGLFVLIPQGLKVHSTPSEASYDAAKSMLSWQFRKDMVKAGMLTLTAGAVLKAPFWSRPEKVLGGKKPGKPVLKLNIPDALYQDGARMAPDTQAWFQMAPPPHQDGPQAPRILGVIFHSQILPKGWDGIRRREVDKVLFNYSVDGRMQGALKQPVNIIKASNLHYWVDGYYDASADRAWTWGDLARLKVAIQASPVGKPDPGLMASLWVNVRTWEPVSVAPVFYATVEEAACRELALRAGTWRLGSQPLGSDPLLLKVNPGLCAPLPTPTPAPTLTPPARPQPTSTPSGPALLSEQPGLGCLDSAPKPFKRGGAFVYFCLKRPAAVRLNVYEASSGRRLRSLDAGEFRAAPKHELFFNGLDDAGAPLRPGSYLLEVEAVHAGRREIRQERVEKAR